MKYILPHPCRCCGYLTYPAPYPEGGICEVCGWISLTRQEWHSQGGPPAALAEATSYFLRTGASDPSFQSSVRPPLPGEIPPEGWETFQNQLEREVQTVMATINSAFSEVELDENVIGLEQSRIIDDYWYNDPPQEYLDAMEVNHATHWTQVLPSLLMHYNEFFCFTNFEGFRYFAPAHATAALQSMRCGGDFDTEIILSALCAPRSDLWQHLSSAQQNALAAFLACVFRFFDREDHVAAAGEALAGYWGRFPNSALMWD